MLSAREFVEIEGSSGRPAFQRAVRRFEELDHQPPEDAARLAKEFEDIVTNRGESLVARTSAAGILWHSAPSLRIIGSADVALALYRVLEDEFLKSHNEADLSRCRFPFFRNLVLAICLIGGRVSDERLTLLPEKLLACEYGVWLTRFLETGRPEA
jgi:hypothetical protein